MDTEDNKTQDESVEPTTNQEIVESTAPEEQVEQPEPALEPTITEHPTTQNSGFKAKLQTWKAAYLAHKKITIPATILLLVVILLGIPATRYPILGVGIKKNLSVVVVDAKTGKPVSSVELSLAGKTVKTDQAGRVTLKKVSVGPYNLKATKKYYRDTNLPVFVSLNGKGDTIVKLDATGRQVKVLVFNTITGRGLGGADVSAAGTEAKTDEKGEAVIVLPAESDTQDVTVTKDGFNKHDTKIKVIESDNVTEENSFSLTPNGKVYFLSKRTGKINVMKSNLDGTNQEVVLAATGGEDDTDTILLASQDWKYLAFKSQRNGATKPASLYLIDTTNGDKLTTMDEGDATFTLTGWSGHTFVYQVQRNKVQYWQPNKSSIKSFDADAKKLNILDNTAGEGSGASTYSGTDYKAEYYTNLILIGDTVNYGKTWISGVYTSDGSSLAGKQSAIYSVKANGQDKKTLKSFEAGKVSSMESRLYKPREAYYRVYVSSSNTPEYYEVENGSVQTKGDLSTQFYAAYPTYLYSPSNKQTFWAESRDGKNSLFVGDESGDNSKSVGELTSDTAYGWFTDDYLLISQNSSELYIISPLDGLGANRATKITDYHKPNTTFYGYGGGYGGL
jgi:hypothetical protein